jgi:hypothetical protein
MGKRREVQGTNHRVREPIKPPDGSVNEDPNASLESLRDYLQRLAEMLSRPKRQDETT